MAYDVRALADQLQHDGVAFDTDNPANWALEEGLLQAKGEIESGGSLHFGVVIVEQTPVMAADVRDLAQDLQLASGFDTVIVRSPGATGVVSDSLSRAQIETAQSAMGAQPDYVVGLHEFARAASEFDIPWMVVTVVAAVVIVTAVIVTLFSVKH